MKVFNKYLHLFDHIVTSPKNKQNYFLNACKNILLSFELIISCLSQVQMGLITDYLTGYQPKTSTWFHRIPDGWP